MISNQTTQEVRTRASIVEVVSDYVTTQEGRPKLLGAVPLSFREDSILYRQRGKGRFLLLRLSGGVATSSSSSCSKTGSLFPSPSSGWRNGTASPSRFPNRAATGAATCSGLNEQASELFHELLLDPSQGSRARAYLTRRGVEESLWRRFHLGFAPRGDVLSGRFRREGVALKDAVEAGLVVEREPGHYRDRFLDRIIFPIDEPGGKIVGFGGRVIDDGKPKYLNSPETPLFHKGSQVYGLRQARDGIRSNDRVVMVEGYLDVLALAQFDTTHVVATLGTALTTDHLRLLGRYTRNVTALFDGDAAGRNAAARSFEVFQQAGLWGHAAFLREGSDPDTFVRTQGKAALDRALESRGAHRGLLSELAAGPATVPISGARAVWPTKSARCSPR